MLIQTAFNFSGVVQRWVCRLSGLRLLALRSLAGMQAFPLVFGFVQPCTARFACKAASFQALGLTHRSSGSPAATAELKR